MALKRSDARLAASDYRAVHKFSRGSHIRTTVHRSLSPAGQGEEDGGPDVAHHVFSQPADDWGATHANYAVNAASGNPFPIPLLDQVYREHLLLCTLICDGRHPPSRQ